MIPGRGSIGIPVERFWRCLKDSTEFRKAVLTSLGITDPYDENNAAHVDAVESRIFLYANESTLESKTLRKPFAVITTRNTKRRVAEGEKSQFENISMFRLLLVAEAFHQSNDNDSYLEFVNFAGTTTDEIGNLARCDHELPLDQLTVLQDAMRTEYIHRDEQPGDNPTGAVEEHINDFWQIVFQWTTR